eukprot:g30918.t1
MREGRVTASVPVDFTCEKCTQLQLLTDRVRELELDELRIIWEAEGVIDRVKDVSDRTYRILKGEGEQLEVVVRNGTNDITRKRDEDLKSE